MTCANTAVSAGRFVSGFISSHINSIGTTITSNPATCGSPPCVVDEKST